MKKRKIIFITVISALILAVLSCASCFLVDHWQKKEKEAENARIFQEYYEGKLALFQGENETCADYEIDVAFLGDSLTDGYDLARYYPQYVTANRGISGDRTHWLESRLKISVYDLKPKVVVMLIGGNNLNTMFENYEDILIGLRDNLPQTKVVLVSLTAMGRSLASKNHLASYNNVIIKKLATKYAFSFVDLYTPLFDEATGEIHVNYTTDGAHLTPLGYQVFTDVLTPTLETLLNG